MACWKNAVIFIVLVILIWCREEIVCIKHQLQVDPRLINNTTGRSDFDYKNKSVNRIAFGSCMNGLFDDSKWHRRPQYVWKQISKQQPDLWIWLGDAAYGDTRLLPFIWTPSPLPLMAKYFKRQKQHPDYQEFLKSNITVVGIWDDHDYGMNDGGKNYGNRLQSQDIFLDFLDEPLGSLRRRREGMYVSYTFGHGDKAVKLIMLDVRSFAVYSKFDKNCDLLGDEQWKWLTEQLDDPTPVALTIVTSGIQILSNTIRGLQNWEDCPHSYDRLIWLTRNRNKVVYLSGDVHFGEISCLNSSSSGYPLYELTSSGLYMACTIPLLNYEQCIWAIRNAIGNDFRITEPVVERNFGLVEIDWNSKPVNIKLQIFGDKGSIVSEVIVGFDHITRQMTAERCPDVKGPEASLTKIYLFWTTLVLFIFAVFLVFVSIIYLMCKLFISLLRSLFGFLWIRTDVTRVSKVKEKFS